MSKIVVASVKEREGSTDVYVEVRSACRVPMVGTSAPTKTRVAPVVSMSAETFAASHSGRQKPSPPSVVDGTSGMSSEYVQSRTLTQALQGALPAIRLALSRFLSELHRERATIPMGRETHEDGLPFPYDLEFLSPPTDGPSEASPDALVDRMALVLFDVRRPAVAAVKETEAAEAAAKAARRQQEQQGKPVSTPSTLQRSIIDREVTRARLHVTFGKGQNAFPGVVLRGKRWWCPSLFFTALDVMIEGRIRSWWHMRSGTLHVAFLDVPHITWTGGEVHLLGCDGPQRGLRAPTFVSSQIPPIVQRILFDAFGMDNPIAIPLKIELNLPGSSTSKIELPPEWLPASDTNNEEPLKGSPTHTSSSSACNEAPLAGSDQSHMLMENHDGPLRNVPYRRTNAALTNLW